MCGSLLSKILRGFINNHPNPIQISVLITTTVTRTITTAIIHQKLVSDKSGTCSTRWRLFTMASSNQRSDFQSPSLFRGHQSLELCSSFRAISTWGLAWNSQLWLKMLKIHGQYFEFYRNPWFSFQKPPISLNIKHHPRSSGVILELVSVGTIWWN